MRKRYTKRALFNATLATILLLLSLCLQAGATPNWSEVFTYQGQLNSGGQPFTGQVMMDFSLWDAAEGGNQIGSGWSQPVSVEGGLFAAEVFIDGAQWLQEQFLQIAVDGTLLDQRQRITPAPSAMAALNAAGDSLWNLQSGALLYSGGVVGIGNFTGGTVTDRLHIRPSLGQNAIRVQTPNPGGGFTTAFRVFANAGASVGVNTTPPERGLRVWGQTRLGTDAEDPESVVVAGGLVVEHGDIFSHSAILGRSTVSNTAFGVGVWGVNASSQGAGVQGTSEHPEGVGVRGVTTNNVGVFGTATGNSGVNYGVYGRSFSGAGFGVHGRNDAAGGVGVWGRGHSVGVRAESTAPGGVGLRAESSSIAVLANGGSGGIFGTGSVIGVSGYVSEADGFAAFFSGEPGSANYFQRAVGINTQQPSGLLTINGDDSGALTLFNIRQNNANRLAVFTTHTVLNGEVFLGGPVSTGGTLDVGALGSGGSFVVCLTGQTAGRLSPCSSSARYKDEIKDFREAGELIGRLRPVSYRWISDGMDDLGLVAEEVALIEPRLVTLNAEGAVEGVRYDRLAAVLVGAVHEQRAEVEALRAQISSRDQLINELQSQLQALQSDTESRLAGLERLLLDQRQLAGGQP